MTRTLSRNTRFNETIKRKLRINPIVLLPLVLAISGAFAGLSLAHPSSGIVVDEGGNVFFADLTRGLSVPVGGGHDRGLLEPDDVVERRTVERIEERQLRRAGVAEEIVDAGGAEDLDQSSGDLHQRGGRGVSIGRPWDTYFASMSRRISAGAFPSAVSRITSRVMSMHNVHVAAWLVYVTSAAVSPLM